MRPSHLLLGYTLLFAAISAIAGCDSMDTQSIDALAPPSSPPSEQRSLKVLNREGTSFTKEAIMPDGDVVVGGSIQTAEGVERAILARFGSDREVDLDFGTEGLAFIGEAGEQIEIGGLAVDTEGRLYVCGDSRSSEGEDKSAIELFRFLDNGRIDATFGQHGRAALSPETVGDSATCLDLVVASSRLIVLGENSPPLSPSPVAFPDVLGELRAGPEAFLFLVGLGLNGAVDSSYGDGGLVSVEKGYGGSQLMTKSEAGLVVSFSEVTSGSAKGDLVAKQFFENGDIDVAFGDTGRALIAESSSMSMPVAVALEHAADGTIAIAGFSYNPSGDPEETNPALWMFDRSGTLQGGLASEQRTKLDNEKGAYFAALIVDSATQVKLLLLLGDESQPVVRQYSAVRENGLLSESKDDFLNLSAARIFPTQNLLIAVGSVRDSFSERGALEYLPSVTFGR